MVEHLPTKGTALGPLPAPPGKKERKKKAKAETSSDLTIPSAQKPPLQIHPRAPSSSERGTRKPGWREADPGHPRHSEVAVLGRLMQEEQPGQGCEGHRV